MNETTTTKRGMKMNCEKSYKRDVIKHWAIKNVETLGMIKVKAEMRKLSRMTLVDVLTKIKHAYL